MAARAEPDFNLTMAFQPVWDAWLGEIYAYEALVDGPPGESAREVIDGIGAGDVGLALLSRFTPDAIKFDPMLVRSCQPAGRAGCWWRR